MKKIRQYSFLILLLLILNSCGSKYDCKIIEKEDSFYIKNTGKEPLLFTYEQNRIETVVHRTDWLLSGEVHKISKTYYSYKKKKDLNIYEIKIVGQTTIEQAKTY